MSATSSLGAPEPGPRAPEPGPGTPGSGPGVPEPASEFPDPVRELPGQVRELPGSVRELPEKVRAQESGDHFQREFRLCRLFGEVVGEAGARGKLTPASCPGRSPGI